MISDSGKKIRRRVCDSAPSGARCTAPRADTDASRQGFSQHHHLCDGFTGDQTHQFTSWVGNADRGNRLLLQQFESLFERGAMADRGHIRDHRLGYMRIRTPRFDRADQVGAPENADRFTGGVNDGKLTLACLQQGLHGFVDMRFGRQGGELRHHRVAHRNAARGRA